MPPTTYASGTKVDWRRSRLELEKLLARHAATQFVAVQDEETATIGFAIGGGYVRFVMPLPDRQSARFTHTPSGRPRALEAQERAYEQALRQQWRALVLVTKAKLQAVEAGISTIEEAFLGDTYVGDEPVGTPWAVTRKERRRFLKLGSSGVVAALGIGLLVPVSSIAALSLPVTAVERIVQPAFGDQPDVFRSARAQVGRRADRTARLAVADLDLAGSTSRSLASFQAHVRSGHAGGITVGPGGTSGKSRAHSAAVVDTAPLAGGAESGSGATSSSGGSAPASSSDGAGSGSASSTPAEPGAGPSPGDTGTAKDSGGKTGSDKGAPKGDGGAKPNDDGGADKGKPADDGGAKDKPKDDGGSKDKPKDDGGAKDQPKDDGGSGDQAKDDGGGSSTPADDGGVNAGPADDGGGNAAPVDDTPKDKGDKPKDDGGGNGNGVPTDDTAKDKADKGDKPKDDGADKDKGDKDKGDKEKGGKGDGGSKDKPKGDGGKDKPKDDGGAKGKH